MFCLSAKGIERINEQVEPDFTLYINNYPIEVSKLIISFFSKTIYNALILNPSLKSYSINIDLNKDINKEFKENIENIKKLMIGKSIEIKKENWKFYEKIGEEIGNEEIIKRSIEIMMEGEEINKDNCIERMKIKGRNNIKIEEEEEFISKHFSEMGVKELEEIGKEIGIEIIEKIMKRKNFQIEKEEEIIEKIKNMKKEYKILMKEVDINNIGKEYLKEYLNIIEEENLIMEVWPNIKNRIIQDEDIKNEDIKERENWSIEERKEFKLEKGKEREGILKYLYDKCGGNIQEKSEVNISAWHNCDSNYLGNMNFTSYTSTCYNSPNEYIQYDFYEKRVKLTNYTIYNTHSHKLLNWKVIGSKDGKKWEDIDEQHLNSQSQEISTYSVETDKSYKYIRFIQTGQNSGGGDYFCYSGFEFFGELEIRKFNE